MPHSIFTGRVRQPGEPLFLQEDTEAAVALAEEERDACPLCGMPKAWCRDHENGRAAFEAVDDWCWVTYHVGERQKRLANENATGRHIPVSARFARDFEPDYWAGLGLAGEERDRPPDDPDNGDQ